MYDFSGNLVAWERSRFELKRPKVSKYQEWNESTKNGMEVPRMEWKYQEWNGSTKNGMEVSRTVSYSGKGSFPKVSFPIPECYNEWRLS